MIKLTEEQMDEIYGENRGDKEVTDNEFLKLVIQGKIQETKRQRRRMSYLVDELL